MKLMVRGRRLGKTTELVAHAKANNLIIAVHNEREQQRLVKEYELEPSMVVLYRDLLNDKSNRGRRNEDRAVCIDNIEMFVHLAVHPRWKVEACTLNNPHIDPKTVAKFKEILNQDDFKKVFFGEWIE